MPHLQSIKQKEQAILLRRRGKSLRFVAKAVNISLSTAQLWTKDVFLTDEQKQHIVDEHRQKLTSGRNNFLHKRKKYRTERETNLFTLSKDEIKKRESDSFFMLGLGLYWAEGFKKDHSLGFVNSDPIMIQIFIKWLKKYGEVNSQDIRLRVQIHEIYKVNIESIQKYWADLLEIPLSQFQTPFFQVSKSKPNFVDSSYQGLLRIRVIGTRNLFLKILGWLEGLKEINS